MEAKMLRLATATILSGALLAPTSLAHASKDAQLKEVARLEHQVTGVTVSRDGRIFVNFPRWMEDAPISVAEVTREGHIKPYPDEQWNSWRNAKKNQMSAGDHFVCVQSVVADAHGNLWVVDPAAPATGPVVPADPSLSGST
jgi:hypothetical protein